VKAIARRGKRTHAPTKGSSPLKRQRRSKNAIQAIRDAICEVLTEFGTATVRQVYYQLVTRGVIAKTEAEYKLACRLLVEMRRSGTVHYTRIADNTRWMRKPRTYSSLAEMLISSRQSYRRAVWDSQDVYVEIWLEKEALAGVLVEVTSQWDVPLMVTRGYPSVSFLYSAAEMIAEQDKPACIYYFGDRDPSGVDIDRFVEEQIRELAPDADLTFERVAVTPEQIVQWNLPTRPTKKSDSRCKSFEGESVEVDAIPPDVLRNLCEDCIRQHIDEDSYERLLTVEEAERETFDRFVEIVEEENTDD
jgi:hypothetical protein